MITSYDVYNVMQFHKIMEDGSEEKFGLHLYEVY